MLSSLVSFLKRGLFGFNKEVSFPYSYKYMDSGLLPDPDVSLDLVTKTGMVTIRFLVDSGSDTIVLPSHFAPIIDVDLTQVTPVTLEGVGGNTVDAYPGKITLKIGSVTFPANCYFLEGNQTPLLGRKDLWSKFTLVFDNQTHKVIFKEL